MAIAIIGASGAVGQELMKLLPQENLKLFSSHSLIDFSDIELAFFCVGSDSAKELIPKARKKGVICIDSSTAYRHDPNVPLVIPEINGDKLHTHQGIIASPNCTTTLMLLPLSPIHRAFGIERIVATSFQAVSGAGYKAVEELRAQTRAYLEGQQLAPQVFKHSCAFTVFPHESPMDERGYVEEEVKMHTETQKILSDPTIKVTATCVRVPVFRVHSISVNVECRTPITKDEVMAALKTAQGTQYKEIPKSSDAEGKHEVLWGKMRMDHTQPNTFELWITGDQLLKGAALNMAQIAQELTKTSFSPVVG